MKTKAQKIPTKMGERIPNTPKQDVAYHVAMCKFMRERKFQELSVSHAVHAWDIAVTYGLLTP